jgi:molybdate transport system ATP-binding protein
MRRVLGQHLEQFRGPRLLITHDPAEAFLLATEIMVIEEGRITQTGTADEIRLAPKTRYVADLVGINLLAGVGRGGAVQLANGTMLNVARSGLEGAVLLTIHPRSISLHTEQPGGSPRNVWLTAVSVLEPMSERVRVQVGDPVPLTAEITTQARQTLGLRAGMPVWVSVKATEIGVDGDQVD